MRTSALIVFIALFLFSCGNRNTLKVGNTVDHGEQSVAARRFTIETTGEINTVKILNPWQDTESTELVYYLIPREMKLPDSLRDRPVIRVPADRIICMSTTHLAMLKALDATDAVVGISGTGLVYDPEIRRAIETGVIPDVGYENNLDKELIVSLSPDVLIAYGVSPASAEYLRKLAEMGVTVMFDADYLEEHPLARCEWLKVFGLLTGKGERADSIIAAVSQKYRELADSLEGIISSRPRVLLGAPWEDVWYVPPSNSYAVRLIVDAGGSYLFGDLITSNAVPYSTEAVFKRATDAEVWLNPGSAISLGDIRSADYRLAQLPVFKSGRVCNNNARANRGGGNDYWESAVVHPDIILRDLASILHPELFPGYSPVYYRILQ
jgi:iron complex transport system substrate-binding protein